MPSLWWLLGFGRQYQISQQGRYRCLLEGSIIWMKSEKFFILSKDSFERVEERNVYRKMPPNILLRGYYTPCQCHLLYHMLHTHIDFPQEMHAGAARRGT